MRMSPTYEAAINGTLVSTSTEPVDSGGWFSFRNVTHVPVGVYLVSDTGVHIGLAPGKGVYRSLEVGRPPVLIPPMQQTGFYVGSVLDGWYFLFVNTGTGAFAAVTRATVKNADERHCLSITPDMLLVSHGIGRPPEPNSSVVIPPDSPRVLVGCGRLEKGNGIAHEQYWRRLPRSYCMGPHEERVRSYTTTTGMDATTSQESVVAVSVGMEAGVGWGPVSASMSASLNTGSSVSQQVNTKSQTTSYVSEGCRNDHDAARLLLCWELTSVVTVFDEDGLPCSSVVYGTEDPAVVCGPYDVDHLPDRPLNKPLPMTQDMRNALAKPPPDEEAATAPGPD